MKAVNYSTNKLNLALMMLILDSKHATPFYQIKLTKNNVCRYMFLKRKKDKEKKLNIFKLGEVNKLGSHLCTVYPALKVLRTLISHLLS